MSGSSNLTILSLIKRNRDTMSGRTHDLGLVVLRVPVTPILDPLIFLQDSHHYRKLR